MHFRSSAPLFSVLSLSVSLFGAPTLAAQDTVAPVDGVAGEAAGESPAVDATTEVEPPATRATPATPAPADASDPIAPAPVAAPAAPKPAVEIAEPVPETAETPAAAGADATDTAATEEVDCDALPRDTDVEACALPVSLAKSKHPIFRTAVGGVPFFFEARAQMRVRGEVVGAVDLSGATPKLPVAHRLRLGTTIGAGSHLRVVAEVQDVRNWGAELPLPGKPGDPTLFGYSGGGIDFHQGYVALNWNKLDVRVGRQEIAFDGQRLIGTVDWTMQGRSFDAVRLSFDAAGHTVNGFAALVRDGDFSPPGTDLPHSGIAGLHYLWSGLDFVKVAPALFLDYQGPLDRLRLTTGVRANGAIAGFAFDLEGYYQGVRTESEITNAALVAARVGYKLDVVVKAQFDLFADLLSGDTDPNSSNGLSSFDTLYATNHKFYGFQDLFLAIPAHTRGRGLADVGASAKVAYGGFFARLDLHLMSATDLSADPLYGFEPDLVVGMKVLDSTSLQAGASVFVPIGTGLGRGSTPTPWAFLQIKTAL